MTKKRSRDGSGNVNSNSANGENKKKSHASLPAAVIEALDDIISPSIDFASFNESQLVNMKSLKSVLLSSDLVLKRLSQSKAADQSVDNKLLRSSLDKRYIMCLLCINIGKMLELKTNGVAAANASYRESLLYFPTSIEGGYSLGLSLRHQVHTMKDLQEVEDIWSSAYSFSSYISFRRAVPCTDANGASVDVGALDRQAFQREKKIVKTLLDALILFRCQENRLKDAAPLLTAGRYTHKLAQEVLCYADRDCASSASAVVLGKKKKQSKKMCTNAAGFDNALSQGMITRLQHVFRPDSPFWREHHYDFYNNASRSVGYFSYLYPYKARSAGNVIEQTIDTIYGMMRTKFPKIATNATIAEWWVHSRPHSCGHQFHFDSDETAIYAGRRAQHPIISCVLYLTPGGSGEVAVSVGGPTIVTNQTLQSEGLATEGFMFHPKENRLIAFDSSYLHGVVPGRGLCNGPANSRRLTFMVGFWEKIQAETLAPDCAGPGQPFPDTPRGNKEEADATISNKEKLSKKVKKLRKLSEKDADVCLSAYTWHHEMTVLQDEGAVAVPPQRSVDPIPVDRIWEPVPTNSTASNSSSSNEVIIAHYDACFQGF